MYGLFCRSLRVEQISLLLLTQTNTEDLSSERRVLSNKTEMTPRPGRGLKMGLHPQLF